MQAALLFTGAGVISLWGIGHLMPTRNIVSGFGRLSPDNVMIITMEWIAEGMTLCFLGVLVASACIALDTAGPATHLVARSAAAMLLALAVLSAFTGARTSVLPMKLCPVVKSVVAVTWIVATLL